MNSNDFVSVNHILSDVLLEANDENLNIGFTKGWYISQIQQYLEERAFDSFYQEITGYCDYTKTSNKWQ